MRYIAVVFVMSAALAGLLAADKATLEQSKQLADKMHARTLYPCVGIMITEEPDETTMVSFLARYQTLGACDSKAACEKAVASACKSVHDCGVRAGTGQIQDLAAGNGKSCSGECACNNASAIIYCYNATGQ